LLDENFFISKSIKMKKLIFCSLAALMMLAIVPVTVTAANEKAPIAVTDTKTIKSPEATALITRLEVIKGMDKSELTPAEKAIYRKETKAIKNRLNDIGGGVYISAGAVIIILLLVIILL